MVSVASLEKIEIIRSQEFMPSEARLKFLKKMIILGPKTAILGPQFCRILVLGPNPGPPGSAPVETNKSEYRQKYVVGSLSLQLCEQYPSRENQTIMNRNH